MGGFFGSNPTDLAFFIQTGIVQRSLDGGASHTNGIWNIPQQEHEGNWITRAVRCPAVADQELYGGFRVWKSGNFFSGATYNDIAWTPKSPALNLTSPVRYITALAFAPADATCATYAHADSGGKVHLTTNNGVTWNPLNPGAELPGRIVTSLAFSPENADTLWAAFSGYNAATPSQPGHVFRAMNATTATPSWSDVSPPP
jgi:hypothetical protein